MQLPFCIHLHSCKQTDAADLLRQKLSLKLDDRPTEFILLLLRRKTIVPSVLLLQLVGVGEVTVQQTG